MHTYTAALPFPIKGGKLWLYNNNPLLIYHYPGTTGMKTGYTIAAGRCLVATAERHGVRLASSLLHSTGARAGGPSESCSNVSFYVSRQHRDQGAGTRGGLASRPASLRACSRAARRSRGVGPGEAIAAAFDLD